MTRSSGLFRFPDIGSVNQRLKPKSRRLIWPTHSTSATRALPGRAQFQSFSAKCQSPEPRAESTALERRQVPHGAEDVAGLREDCVFEERLIGDECVGGGDALYRGIEMMEELVGDAGGNLGSISPT